MTSNFFPCFPALYGGPVLTGAPPPGHGQVWAKPPSNVRGGASLHTPGPLSEHIAGSKPPVKSTCYTDIGEALLPGHHTCRLQVKHTHSLRFRRIQFLLYWRWRGFWIYSFVCASMFCVWDVFFFLLFPLQKVLVFRATSHVLGRQSAHAIATGLSPTGQDSCFKWYMLVLL